MIEAVNDTARDINEVIDAYFDRDNYMQWLAFNILMGNRDTTMQNYYLYSPLNGSKFYFIPWDGDNILHWQEDDLEGLTPSYGGWEHGVANYWGVLLHQRFLKDAGNRQQLADKVEEYMALWCVLQQLKADIMEHGVTLEYKNGSNQYGVTDNKSVASITRVSAQMLQIWTALGFRSQATAANAPPAQDPDEDEL